MDTVALRSGRLGALLAPAAGGSVARLWLETDRGPVELLRPAPPDAVAGRDPWAMGCFPLVPWSNRVREGRFRFDGRAVSLAPDRPGERHPIHGQGWRVAWRVVEAGPAAAVLEHRHDGRSAGTWPWAYCATQRFQLGPAGLRVDLALRNESDRPMPAGLGLHPYLPRTPGTTVTAAVAALWLTDPDVLPVERVAPPPSDRDPGRGLRADAVSLDHPFGGWDGRAVVAWPERGISLAIAAGPPLSTLVVYTPPGQDFLCVEPVSHVTDAVNLAPAGHPDTGLLVLPPGDTLHATVTFTPH